MGVFQTGKFECGLSTLSTVIELINVDFLGCDNSAEAGHENVLVLGRRVPSTVEMNVCSLNVSSNWQPSAFTISKSSPSVLYFLRAS